MWVLVVLMVVGDLMGSVVLLAPEIGSSSAAVATSGPITSAADATITVNILTDESTPGDGSCSLREPINNTNAAPEDTTDGDCAAGSGNDTIVFSVTGTILLIAQFPTIGQRNERIVSNR